MATNVTKVCEKCQAMFRVLCVHCITEDTRSLRGIEEERVWRMSSAIRRFRDNLHMRVLRPGC
jgi:hypothetical protein